MKDLTCEIAKAIPKVKNPKLFFNYMFANF